MERLYISAFRYDNRCRKHVNTSPISPINPEDPGWDSVVRLVILPVSAAEADART